MMQRIKTIITESDIDDVFQSVYTTIISNIQKIVGKGSGWIIDLVVSQTINISKYNTVVAVISNYQKNQTIQK